MYNWLVNEKKLGKNFRDGQNGGKWPIAFGSGFRRPRSLQDNLLLGGQHH